MKHAVYAIPFALALLTACGGDGTAEIDVKNPDGGETTTIRAATDEDEGIAPPENLPAHAAIYPDAKIESTISNAGKEGTGMVSFSVEAKPADIIAFYKKAGESNGLKTVTEANMNWSRMLMMSPTGDSQTAGLQVTVAPSGDDPARQTVALIYTSIVTP